MGIIERDEDKEQYKFKLSSFVGVCGNLIPGVRVHFTIYKEEVRTSWRFRSFTVVELSTIDCAARHKQKHIDKRQQDRTDD